MEYPDCYITTMKCIVRKMATMEDRLIQWTLNAVPLWEYIFQIDGLNIQQKVDVSDYVIGEVLSIEYKDRK